MPRRLAPLVAGLWLVGCASTTGLTVDVRTDYVAGDGFVAVTTELSTMPFTGATSSGMLVRSVATPSMPFLSGARVAEFDGLAAGTYWVRTSLRSASDAVVAARVTKLAVAGPLAITVVIARSCSDTTCPPPGHPELSECNGGTCVDPRCDPTHPDMCGTPQCTHDADCTTGPSGPCVRPACEGGACLYGADDTLCPAGQRCTMSFTCAPASVDAGAPDAGTDAGPCGARGERCCAGEACGASLACVAGACACGGVDQPCCADGSCGPSTTCVSGACRCGQNGQICCAGRMCTGGALCTDTAFGSICLCGQNGQACCTGRVCTDGSLCTDTGFGPLCLCGHDSQICCTGRVCTGGALCTDTIYGPICFCGRNGQACCTGRVCNDGSLCTDTGFGPLCLCGTRTRICCPGGSCTDGSTCTGTGFGPICE